MPIDTSSVLQGLLQSYRPKSSYTFGAFGDDGSGDDQGSNIPSQGQLASPFEQEQTRRAAAADAADQARIQAIRNTQLQAYQEGERGATPQRAYSPGAAPPGTSDTWIAAGKDPVQQMAEAHTAEARYKEDAPVRAEAMKGQVAAAQRKQQYDMMTKMAQMGQASSLAGTTPGGGVQPVASHQTLGGVLGVPGQPQGQGQAQPSPAAQALTPKPEPSWKDILFGGPTAAGGGTLKDLGGAVSSYGKYMSGALPEDSPFSKATQLSSFNNIKMIQATVPGSRGASQLLDKFAEHQAHVGREAPAGSDARLSEMTQMLQGVLEDINREHYNLKMSPTGELTFATDPAQLRNARVAAEGAIRDFQEARQYLRQRFPELNQNQPGAQAAPGGRFSRLPE